jgi:hypothetical protein
VIVSGNIDLARSVNGRKLFHRDVIFPPRFSIAEGACGCETEIAAVLISIPGVIFAQVRLQNPFQRMALCRFHINPQDRSDCGSNIEIGNLL